MLSDEPVTQVYFFSAVFRGSRGVGFMVEEADLPCLECLGLGFRGSGPPTVDDIKSALPITRNIP